MNSALFQAIIWVGYKLILLYLALNSRLIPTYQMNRRPIDAQGEKLHRISEKREKCFNLTHISANGNEDGIVKYLKRNQIHKDCKTFYFSNGAQTTSLSFSLKLKSTFKSKKPRQQLSLYLLLGLIYDQRF